MEEAPLDDFTDSEVRLWLTADHDRQLIRETLRLTPRQRLDELKIAAAFFGRVARPG
ncbi:MAG TPA: hypothetical protein VNA57_14070 [Acidimicrobiales bacterium]|nr:hypothetical protein [Acidimicrobiales bacterium]